MNKLIEKTKFWFIKRKILKILPKTGCDIDGDILNYNGKKYFVHALDKIVKEI